MIYNFWVWRNGLFQVSSFICGMAGVTWDMAFTSTTYSISFIGVERVVTTIWEKKYADFGSPSTIAYVMVAICWIGGISIAAIMLLAAFFNQDLLCYCDPVFALPYYINLSIGLL